VRLGPLGTSTTILSIVLAPMIDNNYGVFAESARETDVIGEKMSKCRFVHHKSHMTWPELKPGPPWWKAGELTASAMARQSVSSSIRTEKHCIRED
jgi:hypothetical protein